MSKIIALVGTLDSKGEEFLYVKKLIEAKGFQTLTIDCGVFEPYFQPDITNMMVAAAAGEEMAEISSRKDRGLATEVMSRGIETLIPQLFADDKFDGILSFGGSGGTSIATAGMKKLPVGVPKVMVSTVAAGKNIEEYVGTSDIVMFPSIVDVSGLNSISERIFSNAAHAMIGMLTYELPERENKKPLIAATMFGVTTPVIDQAREYLESRGYEVLVFHATGTGGKTMESLIQSGLLDGVLDLTTTEWCDELFDGILNAGPNRLEAASLTGLPQVVSVGALDMVNFGSFETVPEKYQSRTLYRHNPTTTLMRTTEVENLELGKKLAEKLNLAKDKTYVLLPLQGISMMDAPGERFYGPQEDQILFDTLKREITNPNVEILEINEHINSSVFAAEAAGRLLELMNEQIKK